MNLSKACCIVGLFFLLLFSCKDDAEGKIMDCTDVIVSETIRKVKTNRGVLTLSNFHVSYSLYAWCPLIYKDTFPSWIEDDSAPEFYETKYEFAAIGDIDAPYVLYKKEKECYLYLIKNNDTLKFNIQNPQ